MMVKGGKGKLNHHPRVVFRDSFVSQQAVPVGQATAKRPAEDEADAEAKRARVEGTGAGPADDGGESGCVVCGAAHVVSTS